MDRFQVFRGHDILIVNIQFYLAVFIFYRISPPAYLHTCSPIGRGIHFVQAQVTFSRYGHTKSSVCEHFDADKFSSRTFDLLVANTLIYVRYLIHVQLSSKYDYICELGIEFQSFSIRNIELCRKMHFYTNASGIWSLRLHRLQ